MSSSNLPDIADKSLVQNIKFNGPQAEYVTALVGQVVNIQCNEGKHNHGSSKVKLVDKTDYNWEFKYYHGRLVAAHVSGKIYAYAIKGKDGGLIRIVHQDSSIKSVLIKNLKEEIKDLSFACSTKEVILGSVDCKGNLFVYQIDKFTKELNSKLLLRVIREEESVRPKTNFRLSWCPFVPNSDEDLDGSEKTFVVLNGWKAEIYSLARLTAKYGSLGVLQPDSSYEGYTEIKHNSNLVDASFSSDACAIALAYQDGYVKFFQLFMYDHDIQKCLHEWMPHEGKPISSINFLDDIIEYTSHCWKFAITGANYNTEIKLWSCETWTCMQTINFLPNPNSVTPDLYLNICSDNRGNYLIVSDVNNRGIYTIELHKNEKEQLVNASQLAHFLVPAPFLSYVPLEAGCRNVPFCFNSSTEDLYDNEDDFDDEAEICVQSLKLLVIQPKKFQECNITFQPEALMHDGLVVTQTVVEKLIDIKNGEAEPHEDAVKIIPELDDLQNSVTLLIQQQQQQHGNSKLTLMTPDDFTSPSKNSKASSIRNSITNENSPPVDKPSESANATEFPRSQKDNFTSAGSSPSREVQEILSLNNSTSGYPQEFYSDLENLQIKQEEKEESPEKDYSAVNENSIIFQDKVNWSKMPKENNDINKQDLETVYLRMNSLETAIKEQSILMQQLHEDMKQLNKSAVANSVRNSIKKEPDDLGKELDAAMSKQHKKIAIMLDNLVQLQTNSDREIYENVLTAMNQLVTKSFSEKVPQLLQQEIKQSILPSIHQAMETYRIQIEAQYQQKFANVQAIVMENFDKALSKKATADAISVHVAKQIIPNLEKSYREIITQSLVPSWERIGAQIFHQISDTFTKGTKEYTASVESYMERQRKVQDKGKEVVSQMQIVSDNLKGNSEKINEIVTSEIHKHFAVFKNIQDKIVHNIKETLSQEMKMGFQRHAQVIEEGVLNAVSRSRAVTPAPHGDTHHQAIAAVQQALAKRAYDEAFQVALSAENLSLVMFVCERVDVNNIFGEECLLSQSVLLALIQQLSMELHKNPEIKLCFIRAAFLGLLPDLPQTRIYIPRILKELTKQLSGFMDTNPPLKQMTDARLLKMAADNMLSRTRQTE
ncbi:unnamed protein product [Ceutorhynchus assimilis]|uniref:Enhancer of mRNA-decapping protein 4 n=1 Tax=Ceutorhynchus assimilis TaxID=467358 RepID=A0A9N9QPR8_9CUCU|nr:unnamed protein product [Ceutorhynchus assimilis]